MMRKIKLLYILLIWLFFSWTTVFNNINIPLRGLISLPALINIYLGILLHVNTIQGQFIMSFITTIFAAYYLLYIITLFHVKQKKKSQKITTTNKQ